MSVYKIHKVEGNLENISLYKALVGVPTHHRVQLLTHLFTLFRDAN